MIANEFATDRRELLMTVLEAAQEVHTTLGPGLNATAYASCLAYELDLRGIATQRQVPLKVEYKSMSFDLAHRIDLVIPGFLAVDVIADEEEQLPAREHAYSLQRLAHCTEYLQLNFGLEDIEHGIYHAHVEILAPESFTPHELLEE